MLKPICVRCCLFFKPAKNGVAIEEGRPIAGGEWGPYKLWQADLYECRGCGTQIVTGFGRGPVAEHYEADYMQTRAAFNPILRVDDC